MIVREKDENTWVLNFVPNARTGVLKIKLQTIYCANSACRKYTFSAKITKEGAKLHCWNLLPESSAKPLPEYIPTPIANDYQEACRIADLSPKASATLARRCLQGMIRDFWGVSKRTLKDEIDAIQEKVDLDTWEAIDSVRKVGNIGAHMEKDINLIVDVEPEEALLLVELIETLFEEWYVTRHERQVRMKSVKMLAENKEAKRLVEVNGFGPSSKG